MQTLEEALGTTLNGMPLPIEEKWELVFSFLFFHLSIGMLVLLVGKVNVS